MASPCCRHGCGSFNGINRVYDFLWLCSPALTCCSCVPPCIPIGLEPLSGFLAAAAPEAFLWLCSPARTWSSWVPSVIGFFAIVLLHFVWSTIRQLPVALTNTYGWIEFLKINIFRRGSDVTQRWWLMSRPARKGGCCFWRNVLRLSDLKQRLAIRVARNKMKKTGNHFFCDALPLCTGLIFYWSRAKNWPVQDRSAKGHNVYSIGCRG